MQKLSGNAIYLATLERAHCKTLWEETEYDFGAMTEPFSIGLSSENAGTWFDDIQREQGKKHIRLGIFLLDGTVIGDVALQDIDWRNKSCTIGLSLAKIGNRSRGYGTEAVELLLAYAFGNIGLERVAASTLERNFPAQRSLDKAGFVLEGRERKAICYAGGRWDRLHYGMLAEEYFIRHNNNNGGAHEGILFGLPHEGT